MPTLPGRSPSLLLELDLTAPLLELEPEDALGKLRSRGKPRLRAVLRTLYEAGRDKHVVGLVVKLGGAGLDFATAQELRDALRAFAASGKPAAGWAETLGEGGNGTVGYVLASGLPDLWLQPSGELALMGVSVETTFLRGALDKVGIEPQLDKRYEYKNAADRLMNTEFTDAHREAVDRLVESAWDEAVALIAAGRRLTGAQVRALADRAPLTADEALAGGLIDHVGYRDQVYAAVRAQVGESAQLLFADRWAPSRPVVQRLRRPRKVVALVDGHGAIATGRTRRSPVQGRQLGSDTVAAAFRAARADDSVRAVLFRVDSPGGSAVASDTIWREVSLTREAGKPVVVSMGALAGSGGYYVACPADVIFAQPTTITGSIGVLGGKAVVSGLLDRVGLSTGTVSRGARARMYSLREGFTDDDRARLAALLDAIYDDFVAKVAAGRAMSREAVHEVARGRVWSGADASRNGLVDHLGGLRAAAARARELGGLGADAPVRPAVHVSMRARLSTPRSSADPRAASMTSGWGELAALATVAGLPGGGPLRMPAILLR